MLKDQNCRNTSQASRLGMSCFWRAHGMKQRTGPQFLFR